MAEVKSTGACDINGRLIRGRWWSAGWGRWLLAEEIKHLCVGLGSWVPAPGLAGGEKGVQKSH